MVCGTSILVENSQTDITRIASNVDGEYKIHNPESYFEVYKEVDKDAYIYSVRDHWYIGDKNRLDDRNEGWYRSSNENLNGSWTVPSFEGHMILPDMTVKCAKPIHGGWMEWEEWSPCSETCSEGVQKRSRKCDNPTPQYGGEDCACNGTDVRMCKLEDCNEKLVYFGIGAGTGFGTFLLLLIVCLILCRKRKPRKPKITANNNVMEMERQESTQSIDEYNEVSDHFMMGEATRQEAEEELKGSKIGEFRFRTSKGKTILSVVGKSNVIRHIVIKEDNGKFTGDSDNYFDSLKELSRFYNKNFIPGYNVKLKRV